ncbi:MAG: SAM-dependent methyltransferase, partial [Mycobacteriales bacterium]
ALVDLHTVAPAELRGLALGAGAVDVRVVTEELTAAWFGWPARTLECAVAPGRLGWGWAMFAYRSWQLLSALDSRLFARVVPAGLFYNGLVTGVRP